MSKFNDLLSKTRVVAVLDTAVATFDVAKDKGNRFIDVQVGKREAKNRTKNAYAAMGQAVREERKSNKSNEDDTPEEES